MVLDDVTEYDITPNGRKEVNIVDLNLIKSY